LWWRDPREGDHLEDLGVDSKGIIKWIFQNGLGRYGLDSSISGKGRRRGLVNPVMYFRVP